MLNSASKYMSRQISQPNLMFLAAGITSILLAISPFGPSLARTSVHLGPNQAWVLTDNLTIIISLASRVFISAPVRSPPCQLQESITGCSVFKARVDYCWFTIIRGFPKVIGVPLESSILIECSIINHPFWGTQFMETSICNSYTIQYIGVYHVHDLGFLSL